MSTLDLLNKNYVEKKGSLQVLSSRWKSITADQHYFSANLTSRFRYILQQLRDVSGSVSFTQFPFLSDAVSVAVQYNNCLEAVARYKDALKKLSVDTQYKDGRDVIAATSKVKQAQNSFDRAHESFRAKYNAPIKDVETMCAVLARSVEASCAKLEKEMTSLLDKARQVMASEQTIELKAGVKLVTANILPDEMIVARRAVQGTPYTILKDLGVSSQYENITNDLRKQGNILIRTSFEQMSDDAIDVFVAAYILRYIEAFPLGSVNVHIIDNNASFLFKRLCNSFQAGNAGEAASKTVKLYSNMDIVGSFQDVVCEDIFKKTSASCFDLFDVYENDQSDAFNLIVLRDGLVGSNGYASVELLDAISTLTKNKNMGHRCGVRFLIIDDSGSHEKSLKANARHLITTVQKNCALQFEYANGHFAYDGKTVEMLRIVGDPDTFVQMRSQEIARALSSKERSYVSLDEISSRKAVPANESIMYIPVGKAGTEAVELPLSCRDDNGTVAGQCIGYMVIGQSGSGKSSFFHSVVLQGCRKYSPRDLQFWLLDFKFGGASSKYNKSGLPHIRIIAENNKIDDALCLFQMISEEMDRRNQAFKKNGVNDIIDYNKKAAECSNLEYFPRVVILIDEVQEIFREDNASVLQKLISSISVRMRSAGMHFIMVAQNLSEGKSYMLKEAFLPSATGRICFRVAQNIPRDSGFPEEFSQRKQEISELKTGEAYVSYGKNTIRKVKMAYASSEDMVGKYFAEIRAQYPEYAERKPLVIGSKQRLSIDQKLQKVNSTYYDAIMALKPINGIYRAIIGEDAYRMEPQMINFSQHENSAVLLLGNDKEISSSLCASISIALAHQGARVHLLNGDRAPIQNGYESIQHPFMLVHKALPGTQPDVASYKPSDFEKVLKELYVEYLRRQRQDQQSDDTLSVFAPEFLVVNDLFGIESFVSNAMIENSSAEEAPASQGSRFDFLAARAKPASQANGQFKENAQNILAMLVRSGYRYNIHVILAIKGEPSIWRNSRIVAEVNNVVMFNPTLFADQANNSYYLKEMLRNIANEDGEETLAVWSGKRSFSKIRPIIYKLAIPAEQVAIDTLIRGE